MRRPKGHDYNHIPDIKIRVLAMEKTKNTGKERTVRREKKIERQLVYILGFLVFLVVLYFVAGAVFKEINSFRYEGLKFTKERYGGDPVYRHYYYLNDSFGRPIQYNLYLLTDPRKNNITIEGDPILFGKRVIYLGVDTTYPDNCSDNLAALVDILGFLRGNQNYVITGYMNKTYAKEKDAKHIVCEKSADWEIIEIFGGNETKINVEGNCHQIIAGPECKIQQAVQKFKGQSLLDARGA